MELVELWMVVPLVSRNVADAFETRLHGKTRMMAKR
jgi:hypothetical protein